MSESRPNKAVTDEELIGVLALFVSLEYRPSQRAPPVCRACSADVSLRGPLC